ncbi:type IIL restriction-modification enzyme MmeI, partial [Maricaulis sp.]|uniref:type IIL restriction-modification enzyme MmeI n=1 Tax=Maricaulis sp. TaxID=1486257 RepID=UPI002604A20B
KGELWKLRCLSTEPAAAQLEQLGASIFEAWTNEPWIVDGAAVRVSIICAGEAHTPVRLNGTLVDKINPDLSSKSKVYLARPMPSNKQTAFQGAKLNGPFDVSAAEARALLTLPINPNGTRNVGVVKRFYGNDDVTQRTQDGWILDFTHLPNIYDAALYEAPFALVSRVREYRATLIKGAKTENEKLDSYWLMQRPRPRLRKATEHLSKCLCVPETSEHLLFRWLPSTGVFSGSLFVIAKDDDVCFGILSGSAHSVWARALGNKMGAGNQSRYNATKTFGTFPFPEGLTPDIPTSAYADDPRAIAIAEAAARLNELRENWLNPADLVRREPEVVPGYPDRILPVDEAAAKELKKRTLTNLYNARPAWLDHAHKALDSAVAAAYGWPDDLSEDEILARLFALNQERAKAQEKAAK